MEQLVDKEVGLPGTGASAHIDDLGVAKDGLFLLIVESRQLIGAGTPDELHRGFIREDFRCQVDQTDNHAIVCDIRGLVDLRVMVDDIVELVLQAECRLGYLVVLAPLVELLEGVCKGPVAARDLIIEIMRNRTHRLRLVSPITIRLQIVELEHIVVFLYPVFSHILEVQTIAKFGFASRIYLCSVNPTVYDL